MIPGIGRVFIWLGKGIPPPNKPLRPRGSSSQAEESSCPAVELSFQAREYSTAEMVYSSIGKDISLGWNRISPGRNAMCRPGKRVCRSPLPPQQTRNRGEPPVEAGGAAAEAQANVLGLPEADARHEEDRVLVGQAVAEGLDVDRRVEAEEGRDPALGRHPFDVVLMRFDPGGEPRQVPPRLLAAHGDQRIAVGQGALGDALDE